MGCIGTTPYRWHTKRGDPGAYKYEVQLKAIEESRV